MKTWQLFCFISLYFAINAYPQESGVSEEYYGYSLSGGAEVPYLFTDHALKETFGGVVSLHFSANIAPVKRTRAFAGIDTRGIFLNIPGTYASPVNTKVFIGCAGLKLGYYSPMANDYMICYSISAGQAYIVYQSVPLPNIRHGEVEKQSSFITPSIILARKVDDQLRVGVDLSFYFLSYNFQPSEIGFTNYAVYTASDTKGITTIFCWGVAAFYAFGKQK